MTQHLSQDEIAETASGAGLSGGANRHLASCPQCRQAVEEERALLAELAALPVEAEPERDLWPAISLRLGRRPGTRSGQRVRPPARRALAWAAALALVVAGFVLGRTSAPPAAPGPSLPASHASEVQRIGTAYVAAVAGLQREGLELTPEVRDQGSEVAIATLYGAAFELARLRPGDPAIARLVDTAAEARRSAARPVVGEATDFPAILPAVALRGSGTRLRQPGALWSLSGDSR